MDLSPASLAFAKAKADSLNIVGITFGVGDVLKLSALNRRFDIIECSGVLHHMDFPAAGLDVLKQCLAPDSILRFALCNDRARASVVAART